MINATKRSATISEPDNPADQLEDKVVDVVTACPYCTVEISGPAAKFKITAGIIQLTFSVSKKGTKIGKTKHIPLVSPCVSGNHFVLPMITLLTLPVKELLFS
jgi:hypothetical protein